MNDNIQFSHDFLESGLSNRSSFLYHFYKGEEQLFNSVYLFNGRYKKNIH